MQIFLGLLLVCPKLVCQHLHLLWRTISHIPTIFSAKHDSLQIKSYNKRKQPRGQLGQDHKKLRHGVSGFLANSGGLGKSCLNKNQTKPNKQTNEKSEQSEKINKTDNKSTKSQINKTEIKQGNVKKKKKQLS